MWTAVMTTVWWYDSVSDIAAHNSNSADDDKGILNLLLMTMVIWSLK
jgi:hypothetical protein